MPDPDRDALSLQAFALRYAAGDLAPAEAAAFEARLAADQAARDALAEAVRLSAAALGQRPPAPDESFRALIRERLRSAVPGWLARRAYRGHPVVWFGIGFTAAAVLTCATLALEPLPPPQAGPDRVADAPPAGPGPRLVAGHPPEAPNPAAPDAAGATDPAGEYGPDDGMRKAAELWAELSTPQRVEKARDDELRMRQMLRDLIPTSPTRPPFGGIETPDP
jgi:hypothetical protein